MPTARTSRLRDWRAHDIGALLPSPGRSLSLLKQMLIYSAPSVTFLEGRTRRLSFVLVETFGVRYLDDGYS